MKTQLYCLTLAIASLLAGQSSAEVPVAIATPGETLSTTLHAEGAQIYECKFNADGKLVWQAREPIATLIFEGKTVGRHYAGPKWEHIDGSTVQARVVSNAPGSTVNDIPWLRLEATLHLGQGTLSGVTSIQRINTRGGMAQGPCDKAGGFLGVPYRADYIFLHPAD